MTEHTPEPLTLATDELQAALDALFPDKAPEVQRVRDAYERFGITLIEQATAMSASGVVAFVEQQRKQGADIRALQGRRIYEGETE